MPDVTLDALDLRLARNKGGVRGISFLHAVDEPGEPGRVGTIVFDQLHHGIGNELSVQADRYSPSSLAVFAGPSALAHVPGALYTSGTAPFLGGGANQGSVIRADSRSHASSFQSGGDVYFVLPAEGAPQGAGKVIKIQGGDGVVSTVITLNLAEHFSGVPVFYDGDWWIGVVDDAGTATAHVQFDVAADTWAKNSAGGDKDVSFFLAVHGGLFSLEDQSATWDLDFTDAAAPVLDTAWSGIVSGKRVPDLTAMYALGRFVLIFGSDGQVIAVADAPPVKSLVPAGVLSDNDPFFGHGAKQWGSDLIVPSDRGLYALNIDRLAGRDVSPLNLQGALGERPFRPSVVTPMGADLLVGTHSDGGEQGNVLVLRRYPEGVFYNHLTGISITGMLTPSRVAAMEYMPVTGKLVMLIGNEYESRVVVLYLPDIRFRRPAVQQISRLRTSTTFGPFPGRKLALQVRGVYPKATTNAVAIRVAPDLGAATLAGNVSAVGPFNLTGARVVGTTFGLLIDMPVGVGDVVTDAAVVDTGDASPITTSYTVPTASDRHMLVAVSQSSLLGAPSVTFNGVSMVNLGRESDGIDGTIVLFGLKNPDEGTHDVVVTFSFTTKTVVGIISFSNTDPDAPIGPVVTSEGASLSPSLSVETAPGEVVLAAVDVNDALARLLAPGGDETQVWEAQQGGAPFTTGYGSTQDGADGGLISPTISGSGTPQWEMIGVSIRPNREWPRLLLPLMLDYTEEPRAGERIQILVEIPTGPRLRDAGNEAVEKVLSDIRALRDGTTKTFTLIDAAGTPSTFTVLVEQIDSNESTLSAHPFREFPEARAVVTLRVV